ncbi:hypothetical protein WG66_016674 [Moniliophthora roreri]|nr:hypothetical protein WG66_016674 [Moniliophthora roreri]
MPRAGRPFDLGIQRMYSGKLADYSCWITKRASLKDILRLKAARGSKSRVSSLVDYDIKSVHSMATSTSPDVYTQDPASVGEQRSNVPIRPLPDVSAPPVPAIPPHLRNIRPLPRPPPVVRKPVPYHSLARPAVPPRSHLRPPMEGIRE